MDKIKQRGLYLSRLLFNIYSPLYMNVNICYLLIIKSLSTPISKWRIPIVELAYRLRGAGR